MRAFYTLALLIELCAVFAMLATVVAFCWANGLSNVGRALAALVVGAAAMLILRCVLGLRLLVAAAACCWGCCCWLLLAAAW
jgi:ribose/xylose/arabinose/galactoside ABC-type transport system permease subunit